MQAVTRLLEPSDRAGWLAMRQALWPDADARDLEHDASEYFAGEGLLRAVFVAAGEDGRLLGFLELSVRPYAEGCSGPTPFIEGWYVTGEQRGRGVGRSLVRAAEGWALEHGYGEIASDATLDNTASHAAHAALGFQEVERIVSFRKELRALQ